MKWILVIAVLGGAAGARAAEVDAVIARGCGGEPFRRAPCVAELAEGVVARIEERIAEGTSGLQGASARELRTFERGLRQSQADWAARVARSCAVQPNALAEARCQLGAALAREDQVVQALAEAGAQAGAAAAFVLPEKLEIFVPLPRAPGGPDLGLGLDLEFPLPPR